MSVTRFRLLGVCCCGGYLVAPGGMQSVKDAVCALAAVEAEVGAQGRHVRL